MLLSWLGKGWLVAVAIFAATAIGLLAEAMRTNANLLGMGIGFVLAAAVVWWAGVWFNRETLGYHRFCGMAFEKWAFVFAPIGLLLVAAGWRIAILS